MSQKDLATKICEKPQIVTEYEQGKAIPNQQILAKMERALGEEWGGREVVRKVVKLDDQMVERDGRDIKGRSFDCTAQHCTALHCAGMKLRGKDKGKPLEAKEPKASAVKASGGKKK
jgi:transcriptional regulator with XRE-family HTH domain